MAHPSSARSPILIYVVPLTNLQLVSRHFNGRAAYTAFTPAFSSYYNGSHVTFETFVQNCVTGGTACYFEPGNLSYIHTNGNGDGACSDPLVMKLDEVYYTCALMTTSYSVRFRSSTEQTSLELLSSKWEDIDPSHDITYGSIGMSIAKILTGAYYLSADIGGSYNWKAKALARSARTSIRTTALFGLLDDALSQPEASRYNRLPAADIALTKNKTLGELVEGLSRNVTLSLFSSSRVWNVTEAV